MQLFLYMHGSCMQHACEMRHISSREGTRKSKGTLKEYPESLIMYRENCDGLLKIVIQLVSHLYLIVTRCLVIVIQVSGI